MRRGSDTSAYAFDGMCEGSYMRSDQAGIWLHAACQPHRSLVRMTKATKRNTDRQTAAAKGTSGTQAADAGLALDWQYVCVTSGASTITTAVCLFLLFS